MLLLITMLVGSLAGDYTEICADADMMLLCRFFFIFVHTFVWKDPSKVVVVVMEWECLLLSFSL